MAKPDFATFFVDATGHEPYPYQRDLAERPDLPVMLHAPTGTGKTEAAGLAWLWRRLCSPDPRVRRNTPRRLVYCLPMRVLVEQTRQRLEHCLARLASKDWLTELSVYTLMGGEMERDWVLNPHEESIIVGTQDMLVSAALNRGYGTNRFQWPVGFALLNNDALWVLDEVQLMGASIPTTSQMAAFRQQLGTFGPMHTLWMSATVQPEWLHTSDHMPPDADRIMGLGAADWSSPGLARRLQAQKTVRVESLGSAERKAYPKELAKRVLALHEPGTLTLVILNTVERAIKLWSTLTQQPAKGRSKRGASSPADVPPSVVLLHSRFRPEDRAQRLTDLMQMATPASSGGIAVSTQVVEAGVDLSAHTLVTELAPWTSLVQRFGRCNRDGSMVDARIVVIDLPDRDSSPYLSEELAAARELITGMQGLSASPATLPTGQVPLPLYDVLRRKDLLQLFDTTPDVSGNDLDISRYVRDTPDKDLQVFWRDIKQGASPASNEPAPQARELCPVTIAALAKYLEEPASRAWHWDHLAQRWSPLSHRQLRPGQVVMLPSQAGCYSAQCGWNRQEGAFVAPLERTKAIAPEGFPDTSAAMNWVTLVEHTDNVVLALNELLHKLDLPDPWVRALQAAARWHDLGKAHCVWQQRVLAGLPSAEQGEKNEIWAKSPAYRWSPHAPRAYYRHELASSLAYLGPFSCPSDEQFLVAYLVAAHHGRVRLAIRSHPDEIQATLSDDRCALGVAHGDIIDPVDLGAGVITPGATLDLSWMELGGDNSWVAKAYALRDDPELGPFRLAYLEALLRTADRLASAREMEG